MNTSTYRTILIGAGLTAAWSIGGCDAGNDADPYAEDPAAESTYSAADERDATQPTTDPATEPMDRPRTTSPQDPASTQGQGMQGQSSVAGTGQLSESEVVGQTVVSQDGEEIGTVVQVVEGDAGQGNLAVVEVGEFLGVGEKQVAIEMDRLSMSADGQIRSDVTEDTLEAMPEFDASAHGQQQTGQGTQ